MDSTKGDLIYNTIEFQLTIQLKNKYFSSFSFLMWGFDRFSPYSYQNNKEKYADDDEQREFSLRECLWFCMTSLTPQACITVMSGLLLFL